MVRQVVMEQKGDSKNGDFKDLTDKDIILLDIEFEDHDIDAATKQYWKKYLKSKENMAAFSHPIKEKSTKKRLVKCI